MDLSIPDLLGKSRGTSYYKSNRVLSDHFSASMIDLLWLGMYSDVKVLAVCLILN